MAQNSTAPRAGKAKQSTVFGGVAILAVGIAVVKVIGALFKIPLSNILGPTGGADFNNAYNIYAVLLSVSTAGLPVALSKMVSEAHTLGRYRQKKRVFQVAMTAFLAVGIVSFLVMWLGNDWLAGLMHNSRAARGIRTLAPAVVCVGCLSAFRGYAQGHMNMVPTSVSQIIEALCKLILGLALASYVMSIPLTGKLAEEQTSIAAAGAIAGVTVGTILALIYMFWDYYFSRSRFSLEGTDQPDSDRTILVSLLRIAIPVTLSCSMVPLINLLDNALIQGQLQKLLLENSSSWTNFQDILDLPALDTAVTAWRDALGTGGALTLSALTKQVDLAQAAEKAGTALTVLDTAALDLHTVLETAGRTLYGNYTATLQLHNLPSSFMTALTASIIPAVSARLARRDKRGAVQLTGSVLRITALLAMPMGVGLMVLARPIMQVLYPKYDAAFTSPMLAMLGPAAILVCLVMVSNSTLQAYGFVNLPIYTMLIGGVLKVIANYNLVTLPSINIHGVPLGILLCYGAVLVLDLLVMRFAIPAFPRLDKLFLKPLLASAVMGAAAWAFHGILARVLGAVPFFTVEGGGLSRMGSAAALFLAIGLAAILYLVLALAMRIVSREDVMLMPKGEKIAKLLRL